MSTTQPDGLHIPFQSHQQHTASISWQNFLNADSSHATLADSSYSHNNIKQESFPSSPSCSSSPSDRTTTTTLLPPPPPGSIDMSSLHGFPYPPPPPIQSNFTQLIPIHSDFIFPPPPPSTFVSHSNKHETNDFSSFDEDLKMMDTSLHFPGIDITRVPLPGHMMTRNSSSSDKENSSSSSSATCSRACTKCFLPPPPPPQPQPQPSFSFAVPVVPPPPPLFSLPPVIPSQEDWSSSTTSSSSDESSSSESDEEKSAAVKIESSAMKNKKKLQPSIMVSDGRMKIRRGGVPTSKKRNFMCKKCERGFVQKCHWKRHAAKCYGLKVREFQCNFCGKTYSTNSNLSQHIRSVHEKEIVFRCELCGKGFPRKSSMKRHLKIHERKREFLRRNKME